jgi:lysophospholipid acyltransferase (LPLAT)-like uncharacterized protein
MLKRLTSHPAVQRAVAWLLGAYLELALGTTRWTLHGADHVASTLAGEPTIAAFWHERLPLMPALWLDARARQPGLRGRVLVSRHKDGRFIGTIMGRFGVGVVHGSTRRDGRDRGGSAALRTLIGVLRAGELVVITPDGPRGPRRHAAAGVAQLAALSGAAVMPCAAQTTRAVVLGTWDRMVLPLPFGRGVLVCGPRIAVPRDGAAEALPRIEAALTEAAEQADLLCR